MKDEKENESMTATIRDLMLANLLMSLTSVIANGVPQ